MKIQGIEMNLLPKGDKVPSGMVQNGTKSFQELLTNALGKTNTLQREAEAKALDVAMGDAGSFHQAVVASEKAMLALQLTVQVQNKVVEAYNEVMRMQI